MNIEDKKSCRKVLIGQNLVLMTMGDRTRLMASEVPLMYRVLWLTLGGCEQEVGSCEGWKWL